MRNLSWLIALWLGAAPAWAEAVFLQSFIWRMEDENFGGFSGLELSQDGESFVALSDRGHITEGRLLREGGRIVGVEAAPLRRLGNGEGGPLAQNRSDAEGLAVAPDGERFLSFEGVARLRTETGPEGRPALLPRHPDFTRMQSNSSLEALAIGPDGALYTIPERSGRMDRPFPVYRLKDGEWQIPFVLPRVGPFLVAGADIGPDGMLYVLERDFTGVGFRSRVRRFGLDGSGGAVVLETGTAVHDNLEGIAVWRDAEGLRITMISDDNFRWFQRTEFVEYRLTD